MGPGVGPALAAAAAAGLSAAPAAAAAAQGLPVERAWETPVVATYGALLLLFGLLTSWAAPACNNPIFAEIVPPSLRNIIYAFDR